MLSYIFVLVGICAIGQFNAFSQYGGSFYVHGYSIKNNQQQRPQNSLTFYQPEIAQQIEIQQYVQSPPQFQQPQNYQVQQQYQLQQFQQYQQKLQKYQQDLQKYYIEKQQYDQMLQQFQQRQQQQQQQYQQQFQQPQQPFQQPQQQFQQQQLNRQPQHPQFQTAQFPQNFQPHNHHPQINSQQPFQLQPQQQFIQPHQAQFPQNYQPQIKPIFQNPQQQNQFPQLQPFPQLPAQQLQQPALPVDHQNQHSITNQNHIVTNVPTSHPSLQTPPEILPPTKTISSTDHVTPTLAPPAEAPSTLTNEVNPESSFVRVPTDEAEIDALLNKVFVPESEQTEKPVTGGKTLAELLRDLKKEDFPQEEEEDSDVEKKTSETTEESLSTSTEKSESPVNSDISEVPVEVEENDSGEAGGDYGFDVRSEEKRRKRSIMREKRRSRHFADLDDFYDNFDHHDHHHHEYDYDHSFNRHAEWHSNYPHDSKRPIGHGGYNCHPHGHGSKHPIHKPTQPQITVSTTESQDSISLNQNTIATGETTVVVNKEEVVTSDVTTKDPVNDIDIRSGFSRRKRDSARQKRASDGVTFEAEEEKTFEEKLKEKQAEMESTSKATTTTTTAVADGPTEVTTVDENSTGPSENGTLDDRFGLFGLGGNRQQRPFGGLLQGVLKSFQNGPGIFGQQQQQQPFGVYPQQPIYPYQQQPMYPYQQPGFPYQQQPYSPYGAQEPYYQQGHSNYPVFA